jgi:hypothetical protein
VRLLTLLLAPLVFAPLLFAQDHQQFVWQGEVDGIAILHLNADKLQVQIKEGEPVARQQYHFYDRLPETRQDARLEVREGRGFVHILDQPRIDNNYTLAISIEDRQPGRSFYSIALYWDTSNTLFERKSGRTGKIHWRGRVDEQALISCQDQTCTSSASQGAPVSGEQFKFSRPLPHQDIDVRREDQDGRGEIRLVEQPSERNHYTARVSIRDPQGGAAEYAFTVVWTRPSNKETAPVVVEAERGMIWTGVVDGRVRVTIHGSSCISQVVQGAPITGERADFVRPLAARSDLKPAVKKLTGRGSIDIIEYPSEKNNYELVFEISDRESGPSTYTVEVDW